MFWMEEDVSVIRIEGRISLRNREVILEQFRQKYKIF